MTTKAGRFVPPTSVLLESLDDEDAFMEDVQLKQVMNRKEKGVVRNTTGHDDTRGGSPSKAVTPVAMERRQTRGCHSVYKSSKLLEDSEDPGTTSKQLGRGRGGARGARRRIGKGVGSNKVPLKKQKLGK